MAAGDAFGYLVNINAASTGTYQPAAGVEICVTAIGLEESATARIRLTNGTITWGQIVNKPSSVNAQGLLSTKIIITNDNYLFLQNDAGGTRAFGFTGIQLK